jgi:hypothetical protein
MKVQGITRWVSKMIKKKKLYHSLVPDHQVTKSTPQANLGSTAIFSLTNLQMIVIYGCFNSAHKHCWKWANDISLQIRKESRQVRERGLVPENSPLLGSVGAKNPCLRQLCCGSFTHHQIDIFPVLGLDLEKRCTKSKN